MTEKKGRPAPTTPIGAGKLGPHPVPDKPKPKK